MSIPRSEVFSPIVGFMKESAAFASSIVFLIYAQQHARAGTDEEFTEAYEMVTRSVTPTYNDPRSYLVSRLFISYVAAFEVFLQDTLLLVLRKDPKKIGQSANFSLAEILDAEGTDQLVRQAAEKTLNELMYRKPSEYLRKVCDLLSIDETPIAVLWSAFVEAKARRDLGVHNAWRCNWVYLKKLTEAEIQSQAKIGESIVPQDEEYLRSVHNSIETLAKKIFDSVAEKHWPDVVPGA